MREKKERMILFIPTSVLCPWLCFLKFMYKNKEKKCILFVCAHYDEEKLNRNKEPFYVQDSTTFVWVSTEYSMLEKKNESCVYRAWRKFYWLCGTWKKEKKKKICNFFCVHTKKFPSVERKINWPNCKFPLIIVVIMVMGIIHAIPDE